MSQKLLPPQPAQTAKFIDLWNDYAWIAWCTRIATRHGWVRFVAMPHAKDEATVRIDEVFIPPFVTETAIPDVLPVDKWPARKTLLSRLKEEQRLVLLGDPGSGKTTLTDWLLTGLSDRGSHPVKSVLGPLVPVSIVVRELGDVKGLTGEALIRRGYDRIVAVEGKGTPPSWEAFCAALEVGQALVVVDGIDELGGKVAREALRTAVWDAMSRWPAARFVLTSRVVGYADVPFEQEITEGDRGSLERIVKAFRSDTTPSFQSAVVAPFDDEQIRQFASNWYARREPNASVAKERADDLVASTQKQESVRALARKPLLLTFMAMVHRVRGVLPHGRAKLYDQIVQAWLETIDTYRGLADRRWKDWEKRQWLADIAVLATANATKQQKKPGENERLVLIPEHQLVQWLLASMHSQRPDVTEEDARDFLDYLAKRTGLLLPRAEGQWSFAHLSYQEFFVAWWLREAVCAPAEDIEAWKVNETQLSWKWVVAPSSSATLQEPFELLMELLAGRRGWCDRILAQLIGTLPPESRVEWSRVAARVALDTEVPLTAATRVQAFKYAWLGRSASLLWPRWTPQPDGDVWAGLLAALDEPNLDLNLSSTGVVDANFLTGRSNLHSLDASFTGIEDMSGLSGCTTLASLNLRAAFRLGQLAPLAALVNLQSLLLMYCPVADLAPLAGLTKLEILDLEGTAVADLSPLVGLANLKKLDIKGIAAWDLRPLHGLLSLQTLRMSTDFPEAELASLRKALPNLAVQQV